MKEKEKGQPIKYFFLSQRQTNNKKQQKNMHKDNALASRVVIVTQEILRAVFLPPSPATGGIPLNIIIDFMKTMTPVFIVSVMAMNNALENPTAWAYFGTHGCYGILWRAKSWLGFGDDRWKRPVPLWNAALTFIGLGLYWMPIGYIVKRPRGQEAPAWLLGVSVMIFGLGVFFHFVSGMFCNWAAMTARRYAENNIFGVSCAHEQDCVGGRQQERQVILSTFGQQALCGFA
jgi:hypothetical protein